MKMRAAVLEEFGEPLVVQEVELAEPEQGEVLVRLVACGVCHTDLYTASGADPSGYAPTVLGHEGAGVVEAVGPGVRRPRASGDHVVTLFSPQCGECVHCRRRAHQPLPGDPRAAEQGLPARRHHPALRRDGEEIRHFMGTSTFAEYTVMPEIALAKVDPEAPLDARLPVRLRPLDRARRGDEHRQGPPRARPASSSAPAWSGSARSPAAACRAPSGSSASTSPRTGSSSPGARARPRR